MAMLTDLSVLQDLCLYLVRLVSPRDSHACRLEPFYERVRVKTHLQGPTRSVIRYKSICKVFGLCFWLRQIGAKHRKMEDRSAVATWIPLVSNNFWVRLLICSNLGDQSHNPIGLLSYLSVTIIVRLYKRSCQSCWDIQWLPGLFMSFRQQRPPPSRGHSFFSVAFL